MCVPSWTGKFRSSKKLNELKDAYGNNDAKLNAVNDKTMDTVNKRLNTVNVQRTVATARIFLQELEDDDNTGYQPRCEESNLDDYVNANRRPLSQHNCLGLTEDRNSSVWNTALSNALQHVAGRPVEIADRKDQSFSNPPSSHHRQAT